MRKNGYINKLVNLTIKHKNGNLSTISGYVTSVTKEYLILLDQDEKEWIFKKSNLDIKLIKKP